jgi:hypothetical protein
MSRLDVTSFLCLLNDSFKGDFIQHITIASVTSLRLLSSFFINQKREESPSEHGTPRSQERLLLLYFINVHSRASQ